MRIPARLWLPSGALSSSTASSIAKSNENTTVVLSGGAGMVSCAAGERAHAPHLRVAGLLEAQCPAHMELRAVARLLKRGQDTLRNSINHA